MLHYTINTILSICRSKKTQYEVLQFWIARLPVLTMFNSVTYFLFIITVNAKNKQTTYVYILKQTRIYKAQLTSYIFKAQVCRRELNGFFYSS